MNLSIFFTRIVKPLRIAGFLVRADKWVCYRASSITLKDWMSGAALPGNQVRRQPCTAMNHGTKCHTCVAPAGWSTRVTGISHSTFQQSPYGPRPYRKFSTAIKVVEKRAALRRCQFGSAASFSQHALLPLFSLHRCRLKLDSLRFEIKSNARHCGRD